MSDVHDLISDYLKEGYSMDAIVKDLSESGNPEEKAFADKWTQTAAQPEYKSGAMVPEEKKKNSLDVVDKVTGLVEEHPEAIATAIGVPYVAKKVGQTINWFEDRKMKKEAHELEKLKAEAYAKQVAKQGSHEHINEILSNPEGVVTPKNLTAEEAVNRLKNIPAQNAPQAPQVPAQAVTPPVAPTQAPAPGPAPVPPTQSVSQAVETGVSPTQALKVDVAKEIDGLKTGSGMPAYAGTGPARERGIRGGNYPSTKEIPEGKAFVPGAQFYDSLANAARGHENAQAIVREHGRYPGTDQEAREWAANFLKATNAPTREAMIAQGIKPNVVEGIFEKHGSGGGKRAVQMAGVAGALTALSNLANAAQSSPTAQHATDLLRSLGSVFGIDASRGDMNTAMQKASGAVKDIGISPDIFANRGEELGRLGGGYVNAGNPVYRKELMEKLATTNDPQYKALLQSELNKLGSVPPAR